MNCHSTRTKFTATRQATGKTQINKNKITKNNKKQKSKAQQKSKTHKKTQKTTQTKQNLRCNLTKEPVKGLSDERFYSLAGHIRSKL